MSERIKHVTDESFDADVLKAKLPVLVDYWAEWCGPCRMIGPAIDESAETYADRLRIAKLNIDQNQRIPSQYHVRGIPTLMLFKGGEVVTTIVGALPKNEIVKRIVGFLPAAASA